MSLWEFRACVDGYEAAHTVEQSGANITDDEHDALVEKYRRYQT